jgi:phosphonate transport system substrate-binding protein
MLVAANGPWDSLDDLKVERDELPKVEFVQPNSNSGFKAALVLLMNEYDALPEREYNYSFSMDYNKSMKNVADGKTDFAPVVSDLLEQAKAEGLIKAESVRSVYESERFPPAAFGHAHNLTPALRQKIADALVNFDWSGTAIAEQFGAAGSSRFVPVNYKDDWANIRRIDDAIEKARR